MTNFHIRTISSETLDKFSALSPQGNYSQTSAMIQLVVQNNPEVTSAYLGIVDEHNELALAFSIYYTKGKFGTEGSILFGPLLSPAYTADPNAELFAAFTKAVKQNAHKYHAVSVTAWPNFIYQVRDTNGKSLEDAPENNMLLQLFTDAGWLHQGFTHGYGHLTNRWNYAKDLRDFSDEKSLWKSYTKMRQRNVRTAERNCVHIRQLSKEELPTFYKILQNTGDRRDFNTRTLDYFNTFFDVFGDKAYFLISELHADEYQQQMAQKKDELTQLVAELEAKIAQHPSHKHTTRLQLAQENLERTKQHLHTANELLTTGTRIALSCGLFVQHAQEMIYLYGGSLPEYNSFYGPALMQHYMMTRTLELGINRYNFYGITGVFNNPDDEGAGVLTFKQGFNGYVEELIGEFILPTKPLQYKIKQIAKKILKK